MARRPGRCRRRRAHRPPAVARRGQSRGDQDPRRDAPRRARPLTGWPLATARENVRFCGDDDPIFATRRGTPRDSHNVRRSLRPAAQRAGLSWVTPHVFRHTLATRLVEHGYDTGMVAKVLGHRSEAFTRRVYVHTREAPRFDELDP